MTEFTGWRLPLLFSSIAQEAHACRSAAALFDISHMGIIVIRGREARAAARRVLTKDVTAVPAQCGSYALLCNEEGGILDDLIVMVESDAQVRLVVNAVNDDRDLAWIREHIAGMGADAELLRGRSFAVALQGPQAEGILGAVAEGEAPEWFATQAPMAVAGAPVLASRTGYTGEDGFELFGEAADGIGVWEALLEAGAVPAGLAARDVLRQEVGFPLWGQDISEATSPHEARLKWVIDWEGEFAGKEALARVEPRRLRTGFRVLSPGVARAGAAVFCAGSRIGELTSGTYSHNLSLAIGQGYLSVSANAGTGDPVEMEARGRRLRAEVAKLPLLPLRTRPSWARAKGRGQP
jgi:aminomethyltransferase